MKNPLVFQEEGALWGLMPRSLSQPSMKTGYGLSERLSIGFLGK